jgi:glycosyltransferase involved in cell wall biosynthesis
MGVAILTVVIVSDYQSGSDRTWDDERKCLRSLAAQAIAAPVDYFLCLEAEEEGMAPADLFEILPGLQVHYLPGGDSYSLKNAGVRLASSPYIAMLDADCTPSPNWLRCAVETLERRPEVSGVSGSTQYEGAELMVRLLALLSRSFLDPGGTGETRYLSNNCGVIRREDYLRHPLPEKLGPFSARIQSEGLLREGKTFWFDRSILVMHEFEGWGMERDIRRNIGWGTVSTRLEDPQLPYAGLVRLGVLAIPVIWAGKQWNSWIDCLRCLGQYRVKWYELPAALLLSCVVISMEIPGMWLAYQRKRLAGTAYR